MNDLISDVFEMFAEIQVSISKKPSIARVIVSVVEVDEFTVTQISDVLWVSS